MASMINFEEIQELERIVALMYEDFNEDVTPVQLNRYFELSKKYPSHAEKLFDALEVNLVDEAYPELTPFGFGELVKNSSTTPLLEKAKGIALRLQEEGVNTLDVDNIHKWSPERLSSFVSSNSKATTAQSCD